MRARHLLLAGILAAVPALPLPGAPARAQKAGPRAVVKDTPKTADIRKLLNLTGAGKLGVQVMNQLLASFKQTAPQVPEQFWQDLMKEVNPDELVNMVVPLYDKYLSHEDIKAALVFYETPAGRRLVEATPKITQESTVLGQEWGRQLAEKVMKKLQAQQQQQPKQK